MSHLENALARIFDPSGQGPLAFVATNAEKSRKQWAALDSLSAQQSAALPLRGCLFSAKDLFDIEGEVTRAGSLTLNREPARFDSTAVKRLKDAGAVCVGRTHMTEFAYSGVGLNPHFPNPHNPCDKHVHRITGGSSGGAAVSVAESMCDFALATDTGGSVRIPAALCGVIGFKPTTQRIPRDGVIPLSTTYDSVGVLAKTISNIILADAVLSQDASLPVFPRSTIHLGIVSGAVFDRCDDTVRSAWHRTRQLLSTHMHVNQTTVDPLTVVSPLLKNGGIAAFEATQWHLARKHLWDQYDPRVRRRLERGMAIDQETYDQLLARRTAAVREFWGCMTNLDALILPTVPIVAPPKESLQSDEAFFDINSLLLRNNSWVNVLGGCAISLPIHRRNELPVGLLLVGPPYSDRRLLSVAQDIAELLQPPVLINR